MLGKNEVYQFSGVVISLDPRQCIGSRGSLGLKMSSSVVGRRPMYKALH